jgi:8-oxo-dGTP diphosphatase
VSDVSQSRISAASSGDGDGRQLGADETLVDLRCSMIIFRRDDVLLLHRADADEWVLPGGRPRPGESMVSCARREVREETGLSIIPGRCALVLEVAAPDRGSHIVELVFLAAPVVTDYTLHEGEPGRVPVWMPLSDIASIPLRPPIGGHLPSFVRDSRASAAYLGNVWRPAGVDDTSHSGEPAVGITDRCGPGL